MNQDVRDFIANEKQLKQKHEQTIRDIDSLLKSEMKSLGRKLDIFEFYELKSKLKDMVQGQTLLITDVSCFKDYIDCGDSELFEFTAKMGLMGEEFAELWKYMSVYTDSDESIICAYLAYPKDKLYELLSDKELLDCITSFGKPEMMKDKMNKLGVKSRKQFLDNIQKEQAVRWLRLKAQEVLKKYKG